MIAVSACLAGVPCKYSGGDNGIIQMIDYVKKNPVLLVCPEQLGGLSTPRTPCELCQGRVLDQNGHDQTEAYRLGASETLKLITENKISLAVLKSRSPSCGKGKVYDGTFTHTLIQGNGLTAELLIKNGIEVIDEEEWLKRAGKEE